MRIDEKGVSPVIGVILMVAITVILAAVIASFVFGMAGTVTKPKTPGLNLKRIDANTVSAVLIDLGGAVTITNCTMYYLNGSEAAKNDTATLQQVGNVVTFSNIGYGYYRLVCKVDGAQQVVWEGNI